MKMLRFISTLILILIIITSCDKGGDNRMQDVNIFDYLSYEILSEIYYDNKEIINKIKDELLLSDYNPVGWIPGSNMNTADAHDLFLRYENNELIISGGYNIALGSFENAYDYIIDYFTSINKNLNPRINYREVRENTFIEFDFHDNIIGAHAGIIYKTTSELWGEVHLEDDWYIYKYRMD